MLIHVPCRGGEASGLPIFVSVTMRKAALAAGQAFRAPRPTCHSRSEAFF